jgi:WD40 repeat protein/serine/threonine protein kinase
MIHCPSSELLQQFLADRLSGPEAEALDAHVETCGFCQQALERLTGETGSAENKGRPSEGASEDAFLRGLEEMPPTRSWQARQRPRIEDYVAHTPETERSALLRELVALEIDCRRQAGEDPSATEYQRRFPALDPGALAEALDVPITQGSDPSVTIPGYQVVDTLGEGGMGLVLRVYEPRLNRHLAVKVLSGQHQTHADAVRRFVEEARIVGQLQHPGIAPIHELGKLPDGRPYFTMKLISGSTLADLLKRRAAPAMELPRFLAIFEQICQTLAYAHSRGIIHRDLKPSNVMVGAFGEVQLMDWGLGKVLHDEKSDSQSLTTDAIPAVWVADEYNTQPGTIMGTWAYMPPEQARGESSRIGRPSDVFGLGAILCEILTSQPPFSGKTGEMIADVRTGCLQPAFERLDKSNLDAELVQLCKQCLSPQAQHRPKDAGEVAAAVRAYMDGIQARLREQLRRTNYLRTLGLAHREWRDNNCTRAKALLDSCDPEFRNWEWHYLCRLLHNEVQVFREHERVWLARFTADGSHLITAAGSTVRIWEVQSGREVKTFRAPEDMEVTGHITITPGATRLGWAASNGRVWILDLTCGRTISCLHYFAADPEKTRIRFMAISPDGNSVITVANDFLAILWEVASGRRRGIIGDGQNRICAVCWSPDGSQLATVATDGVAALWDSASLDRIWLLPCEDDLVTSVVFNHDGSFILGSTVDGKVICWDTATGTPKRSMACGETEVTTLAVSEDAQFLATAGHQSAVKLWRLENGALVHVLAANTTWVQRLAFSPDGARLAATTYKEGVVHVWDTDSGEEMVTIRGHDRRGINDLQFSRDGALIATASEDGTTRIWDAENRPDGGEVISLGNDSCCDLAISPDGSQVLTALSSGQVVIARKSSKELTAIAVAPEQQGFCMALNPDGRFLATAPYKSNVVTVWNIQSSSQQTRFEVGAASVRLIGYSPDGRLLCTADSDHAVRLWDGSSGAEVGKLTGHTHRIDAMAFSPDFRFVATGSIDSTVRIFLLESRACTTVLSGDGEQVTSLAFSPDSRWLAVGYGPRIAPSDLTLDYSKVMIPRCFLESCNLRIWDADTGRIVQRIRAHDGYLSSLEFNRDGRRILTASYDETIRLWDATTGEEVITLQGHRVHGFGEVYARFSANSCIFSVATNGPVRIWDARPASTLGRAVSLRPDTDTGAKTVAG